MLPYLGIHHDRLLEILIYGAIIFFGVILIMGARTFVVTTSRKKAESARAEEDTRPEIESDVDLLATKVHRPMPLLLVVLYVGVIVWAIFYILAFIYWGNAFPD